MSKQILISYIQDCYHTHQYGYTWHDLAMVALVCTYLGLVLYFFGFLIQLSNVFIELCAELVDILLSVGCAFVHCSAQSVHLRTKALD